MQKDSFYSWIVAFGLFIVNCIEDGIFKAFGVLLIPLSEEYSVKVWIIGSTIATMCFVGSAVGMIKLLLVNFKIYNNLYFHTIQIKITRYK